MRQQSILSIQTDLANFQHGPHKVIIKYIYKFQMNEKEWSLTTKYNSAGSIRLCGKNFKVNVSWSMRWQSSTTKPFTFKAEEKVENWYHTGGKLCFYINQKKSVYTSLQDVKNRTFSTSRSIGFIALQNWFLYPRNRNESYVLVTENEITIIEINHKVPGVFYAGYVAITPLITKWEFDMYALKVTTIRGHLCHLIWL